VRNERATIGRVTGLPAQLHLERRQRANHPEPRLHYDYANSYEMRDAKPPIAHPGPVECLARKNQNEPGDDEGHKKCVQ